MLIILLGRAVYLSNLPRHRARVFPGAILLDPSEVPPVERVMCVRAHVCVYLYTKHQEDGYEAAAGSNLESLAS